ncbi:MAG: hypothetical protein KBT01_07745 [Clostridiales bacterium]|nr:hypothetical protein [Candidatus Blautia equi]
MREKPVIRESGFDGWVIIESEYNREPDRAVWEAAFQKDRKFILENLA